MKGHRRHGSFRESLTNLIRRRTTRIKEDNLCDVEIDKLNVQEPNLPTTAKATLLSLPIELLSSVAASISFTDLLHIRATCKKARGIFSAGELPRAWMLAQMLGEHESNDIVHMRVCIRLYPPPQPVSLHYLLDQWRRISSAIKLTDAISALCEEYDLRSPDRGLLSSDVPISSLVFNSCPEMVSVKGNEVPSLLMVQHYLEHLRDKTMDFCTSDCAGAALVWDQLHAVTFDRYEKEHFLSAHRMFQVLCWFMTRLLDSSSEHIVPFGRRTLSDQDVRQFVVLGGLRGIAQLATLKSFKERQSLVRDLVRSHDSTKNKHWLETWRSCGLQYRPNDNPPSSVNVTKTEFGFQDLWMRAAVDHLVTLPIRPLRIPLMPQSVACRRTVDAYTDIAGYHCVQGPGSW